ncbi:MAG: hypothetical protein ACI4RA_05965 [Kiritimatiellia bacterium]
MRKNRKIKKNSMLAAGTWGVASLIVTALIVVMGYYVLDSQCNQIQREIGKAEKQYKALEAECVREVARWEGMKIRERLEERLSRSGLEMRYPQPSQVVYLDADGRAKKESSTAVARAAARARSVNLALNAPVEPLRPASRRPTSKRVSPAAVPKRVARR